MKILISSPSSSQLRPHYWTYNNNIHKNHHKALKSFSPKATSQKNLKPQSPPNNVKPKGFTGTTTGDQYPPGKFMIIEESGDPDDDTIPQEVFERMMGRIGTFVGAPLLAGLMALKLLGEAKDHNIEIPIWVQIVVIMSTFGMSPVGLAYGALSASWDAQRKGSLLGFEEVQQNWGDMWKEEDEYNEKIKTNNNSNSENKQ